MSALLMYHDRLSSRRLAVMISLTELNLCLVDDEAAVLSTPHPVQPRYDKGRYFETALAGAIISKTLDLSICNDGG